MRSKSALIAVALADILFASCAPEVAATPREAQIEDFEFARANYVMKSQAFSPATRRKALTFINRLETRAGSLSNEAFLAAVLQISAFARNAHDSLGFGDGWRPHTRLPLHLLWFPDGMVIARAAPELSELLGARVEKIEGFRPDQLLIRLRSICGGTNRYLKWNVPWFIESGGMLYALGAAQAPDQLRFDLALADGHRVKRTIEFAPEADVPRGFTRVRYWSAEPFPAEVERRWRTATSLATEPFYLQQGDEAFRMGPLPKLEVLYVRFRANSTADANGQEIAPFVKRVRDEIETARPQNLILDLRFDIGGDIDQTRDLIRAMAANAKGRIYVLTGPYTFSAGIVAAAAMKHDGGSRVTLVGEPVGDGLRFWSESEKACLPNSHYCLHATTGLWDLTKGCAGESGCYGDRLDARVGSLEPKLRAPLTTAAWLAGGDPGMEAIKADLAACPY